MQNILNHSQRYVAENQCLQNKVNEQQCENIHKTQLLHLEHAQKERTRTRTTSEVDTMETDEHPQDFLSESDSEESDIDVAHELEDIITNMNISFTNIVSLRKQYLKALEKYDEIEDEDKEIFSKSI